MKGFEEQLAELEKIVEQLEHGDLTLEENIQLFEVGMKLSSGCKEQLAQAESRIQVLLDPKENGPVRSGDLEIGEAEDEDEIDEEEDFST